MSEMFRYEYQKLNLNIKFKDYKVPVCIIRDSV